jgi:ribosome-binding factor A
MSKLDQINEVLLKAISEFIVKEIYAPDILITITEVKCTKDMRFTAIFVSILPDKLFGSTLEMLRKNNSHLSQYIKRHTVLRRIPRVRWIADDTEKKAAELEKVFKLIE